MRLLLLTLFLNSAVYGIEGVLDEYTQLRHLVQSTEHNLNAQRRLLSLLEAYREAEDQLLMLDDAQEARHHTARLVVMAREVRKSIADQNLEDYFTPTFLAELTEVARLSGQRKVSRR